MTYKTKRSLAQRGKHGAKKLKVHHPDEAPAPATKRCRYGYPAPVAADAPPPSAHGPVRYARPPDLYEIVCALSPIELWYHVHFVPMQEADLCLAPDKLTTLNCSEMEWPPTPPSAPRDMTFPDHGSEL